MGSVNCTEVLGLKGACGVWDRAAAVIGIGGAQSAGVMGYVGRAP